MTKISYGSYVRPSDSFTKGSSVEYGGSSTVGTIVEEINAPVAGGAIRRRTALPLVKRRFRGIVLELLGENARVGFEDDGKVIEYILPSVQLRKAGVSHLNQPFEMDEVESKTDGGYFVGYVFRPLAKSGDSFKDSVVLTPERQAKLKALFEKHKDAAP